MAFGEQALFGQDRLARAGSTHHERDRIEDEPTAEHVVEPVVAGGEAFHQVDGLARFPCERARPEQVADGGDELQGHDRFGQECARPGIEGGLGEIDR